MNDDNETPEGSSGFGNEPASSETVGIPPVANTTQFLHLPPPPGSAKATLPLTIGDIAVTADTIITPNGTAPLAGSHWMFVDRSQTEQKIPSSAIVLAIIFAFACLLGLLFLLMKETRVTGYVEVTVRSGSLSHMTQIPVSSQADIVRFRGVVGQAQSMAASA